MSQRSEPWTEEDIAAMRRANQVRITGVQLPLDEVIELSNARREHRALCERIEELPEGLTTKDLLIAILFGLPQREQFPDTALREALQDMEYWYHGPFKSFARCNDKKYGDDTKYKQLRDELFVDGYLEWREEYGHLMLQCTEKITSADSQEMFLKFNSDFQEVIARATGKVLGEYRK